MPAMQLNYALIMPTFKLVEIREPKDGFQILVLRLEDRKKTLLSKASVNDSFFYHKIEEGGSLLKLDEIAEIPADSFVVKKRPFIITENNASVSKVADWIIFK